MKHLILLLAAIAIGSMGTYFAFYRNAEGILWCSILVTVWLFVLIAEKEWTVKSVTKIPTAAGQATLIICVAACVFCAPCRTTPCAWSGSNAGVGRATQLKLLWTNTNEDYMKQRQHKRQIKMIRTERHRKMPHDLRREIEYFWELRFKLWKAKRRWENAQFLK